MKCILDVLSTTFKLKDTSNLNIILFSWKPLSKRDSFSIKVEESINQKILILNYKFGDETNCLWSEMEETYDAKEATDEVCFILKLKTFLSLLLHILSDFFQNNKHPILKI